MSLIISGATIIDGVGDKAIEGQSIWIEAGRINAIGRRSDFGIAREVEAIDARGRYVIPGLMNANVHLLAGIFPPGDLLRYMDRYEDLAAEAAQVALKNGLTTVFDTAGPRKPLMAVRDKINAGALPGSRVFCAGWIVGLDGILSADFNPRAGEVFSAALVEQINGLCVENVGPALVWMTPEQVAQEVRTYIGKGIDFMKYGSCEHMSAPLLFSPRTQTLMVEEAHRAGITAQAHTMSVESLLISVEAGCDLIQHCNITGPTHIPQTTLDLIAARKTGAVVFPFTQLRLDWMKRNADDWTRRMLVETADTNVRNLVQAGAMLLLANDGAVYGPDLETDPVVGRSWLAPGEDNLNVMDEGHFVWLKAMEEKGMAPMEMLKAATRNIAAAYGKDKDLGTLEPGKIADMLILEKNPLISASNYRSIHMILKDGVVVDRDALPLSPVLTKPPEPPSAEAVAYRAHRNSGRNGFPTCPMCAHR